jgi:hypothetical protein
MLAPFRRLLRKINVFARVIDQADWQGYAGLAIFAAKSVKPGLLMLPLQDPRIEPVGSKRGVALERLAAAPPQL